MGLGSDGVEEMVDSLMDSKMMYALGKQPTMKLVLPEEAGFPRGSWLSLRKNMSPFLNVMRESHFL